MLFNQAQYYQAVCSRDSRFDGSFFFGVSSTGIYCRPVCPVKTPNLENCIFFLNAAAAEAAGFRPCLRCRPELIPGNASVDAADRLTQNALSLIEDGFLNDTNVANLAKELGVTDRHLRRVFHEALGVNPIKFVQTQRLLLAKRLLTDTTLPITEVTFAAGFNSLRRFNTLFKSRYTLSPTQFRKHINIQQSLNSLSFKLNYRPPLDWLSLLNFINERAIPRTEEVFNGVYRRIVRLYHRNQWHIGWITAELLTNPPVIQVIIDIKLTQVIFPVLKYIKKLFDLTCSPEKIILALGPLAKSRTGLRVPGAFDGFEVAVQTILAQKETKKTTDTVVEKFVNYFGEPHPTPFATLTHAFPIPKRIALASIEEISALGIPQFKAEVIVILAQAVERKNLDLIPYADTVSTIEQLRSLPGINEESVQYITMRALSWPDAFPLCNKDLAKALGIRSTRIAHNITKTWQPWRSYAAIYLMSKLLEEK
ncbi:MAG: helix-turn-helix domain-containing protein [Alphaproteobacteria bacterium]|nr:helix-turn-helix domain-containing protein [Alphaproteobacteria bacterium]